MRIRWVGVPKEVRRQLRKELRDRGGDEFLVCSEVGRDQQVKLHIRESLWAFNTEFIASHTRVNLGHAGVKALEHAQGKLCEDANELVFAVLKSFRAFWKSAVRADGYGHFLATFDGIETDVAVTPGVLDRMATDKDPPSKYFYIYRLN